MTESDRSSVLLERLSDADRERLDQAMDAYFNDRMANKPALDELLASLAPAETERPALFRAALGGPLVMEPYRTGDRRRLEDLIDQGRAAFGNGPDVAARWVKRELGRNPVPEVMAAAKELFQGTYRPPVAHPGTAPPPTRPLSNIWRHRLRDPRAYVLMDLHRRIGSRRIDVERQAKRRSKKREMNLDPLDLQDLADTVVATAAVAEAQGEGSNVFAGLIEAAAACGHGLSPLELQVIERRRLGERYVDIADDLGRDPSTVRQFAFRARKKLKQAGQQSL